MEVRAALSNQVTPETLRLIYGGVLDSVLQLLAEKLNIQMAATLDWDEVMLSLMLRPEEQRPPRELVESYTDLKGLVEVFEVERAYCCDQCKCSETDIELPGGRKLKRKDPLPEGKQKTTRQREFRAMALQWVDDIKELKVRVVAVTVMAVMWKEKPIIKLLQGEALKGIGEGQVAYGVRGEDIAKRADQVYNETVARLKAERDARATMDRESASKPGPSTSPPDEDPKNEDPKDKKRRRGRKKDNRPSE